MTDKAYFSEQIRAHEGSIYGLAYSILKNEHDAADAMQDAILKAYGSLHTLRDRSKFKSWMLTIVHNTAMEHLRRLRPTVDIDEQYDLAAPAPSIDHETRQTVWEAVQKLKLPYREIVLLFYYENYSTGQIAQMLDSPPATIRQQLFRARKMLAQLLNKEDFDR